MQTNYDLYHESTARAGEPAYYASKPRGCIEVREDGRRYFYRVPGFMRAGFGAWVRATFGDFGNNKVSGSVRSGFRVE